MMHVKPEKPDSHDSLDYKGSSRIPSGPRKVPTGPAPGQTFEDWLSDDEDGFNPFCQDHLDKEDAPPKDDEWDLFLSCILVKQETKLPMPIHVSVRQYEQPMRIMVSQHYGDKLVPEEVFFLTIEDTPKLNGSKGDISSQDVEQLCRWIHANRDMIKKVWDYEVHVFKAQWTLVA